MFQKIKEKLKRGAERERNFDLPLGKFSKRLWPWQEWKLALFVAGLAMLDFISTYAALKLSGNPYIAEAGKLAKWALDVGGFPVLFVIDCAALAGIILLAYGIRYAYTKHGYPGFGRAGFVFMLTPYAVIIIAVVLNNVVLTFI
jgi:hypothetical protein